MATTQQHAAARSEETERLLPALAAPSQSKVQASFTDALKH